MGARLYLAGPEVFLPDAREVGEAKREVCRRHGLVGIFPLDDGESDVGAAAIFALCLRHLRGCEAVIANLTPFRGPSADPGTAVELGVALGLGIPVFGYTNLPGDLKERVRPDGMSVEDFGLFDNLMLAEALSPTGGVVEPPGQVADPARDLAAFELCVERATAWLSRRSP